MRAVIPVAGVGTRLRPHTYALPKVLLNVAGKPILAHILDKVNSYGIDTATIITGYMGDLVQSFVKKYYSFMKLEFVEQKKMMGLGHAIWTGKDSYTADEDLLIILGDTIFDVDLNNTLKSKTNSIGVKYVDDPRRFGVVVLNSKDCTSEQQPTIQNLIEKPENPISNLAIVGLYYIKEAQKLTSALDTIIENNIQTKNEYQLTDALQIMLDNGELFTTFNVEGWYDCGKSETLLATSKFLLAHYPQPQQINGAVIISPSFVASDAIIENSIIGPYTSIATGAIIKNSIIKNSIISYEAKVENSLLNESIIGNNAEVIGKFNKFNVGSSSTFELD